MKHIMWLFALICLCQEASAQGINRPDKTINFIRHYFKKYNNRPFINPKTDSVKLVYVNRLNLLEIESIKTELFQKDTIYGNWEEDPKQTHFLVLNQNEKQYINQEIQKMKSDTLGSNIIENTIVIDRTYLDYMFCNVIGQLAFYKRFKQGFYDFSRPVFLRNDSLCIFYCSYNCGTLCGESSLMIFKREGKEWKKWITVFQVIS